MNEVTPIKEHLDRNNARSCHGNWNWWNGTFYRQILWWTEEDDEQDLVEDEHGA